MFYHLFTCSELCLGTDALFSQLVPWWAVAGGICHHSLLQLPWVNRCGPKAVVHLSVSCHLSDADLSHHYRLALLYLNYNHTSLGRLWALTWVSPGISPWMKQVNNQHLDISPLWNIGWYTLPICQDILFAYTPAYHTCQSRPVGSLFRPLMEGHYLLVVG